MAEAELQFFFLFMLFFVCFFLFSIYNSTTDVSFYQQSLCKPTKKSAFQNNTVHNAAAIVGFLCLIRHDPQDLHKTVP